MSKLIVEMEMPKVCITKDGYYGNCPMDRVWCVQRNAPIGTKMRDAYVEMTDNIPSWCPICGVLPDEHGDLIDRDVTIQTFKCIEEAPYSGFDGQEAFYTPEDVMNTLLCQDVVIVAAKQMLHISARTEKGIEHEDD